MKIKVSESINIQIDWLVAKCLGDEVNWLNWYLEYQQHAGCYSTDWAQGGPIIEKYKIELALSSDGEVAGESGWYSCMSNDTRSTEELCYADGATPLIAATRCFIVSKLGDEVEVPDELV